MNLFLKIFLLFFFIELASVVNAQNNGEAVFNFSRLPFSARNTSLGGDIIAINDNDISLASINPSLINENISGHINLNYTKYFAGINIGDVSYSKHFNNIGSFLANVKYINYGTFDETDYTGLSIGEFYASDYMFSIAYAKQLDSMFSLGAKGNVIYSVIDKQKAVGITADVGVSYYNKAKDLCASILLRNYGRELKSYYDSQEKDKIKYDFEAGVSKRLKHTPFRFSITYNNMQKFDLWDGLIQDTSEVNILTGETIAPKKITTTEKTLRHIVLGTELIFSKNFSIRVGYNHNRRQSMRIDTKSGILGFSWGFGFKIKKIKIEYSSSKYHFGGNLNTFSITANISDFVKKPK
ncbi:MAG: hypothetical protein A2X02_05530 [Bacteroidetes bacterium GWF2_29_10]|nr:MAG: hypothetical protein A2X02_05530 [Bacteroidetes bacterium GWF2_29_10]